MHAVLHRVGRVALHTLCMSLQYCDWLLALLTLEQSLHVLIVKHNWRLLRIIVLSLCFMLTARSVF